jgi:hypothetical protein|uniref:Replication origin-binding protein n=1 Tax=viral metagenome TaxID=1070528 RepID=A0A6C0IZ35_9ZZZZ
MDTDIELHDVSDCECYDEAELETDRLLDIKIGGFISPEQCKGKRIIFSDGKYWDTETEDISKYKKEVIKQSQPQKIYIPVAKGAKESTVKNIICEKYNEFFFGKTFELLTPDDIETCKQYNEKKNILFIINNGTYVKHAGCTKSFVRELRQTYKKIDIAEFPKTTYNEGTTFITLTDDDTKDGTKWFMLPSMLNIRHSSEEFGITDVDMDEVCGRIQEEFDDEIQLEQQINNFFIFEGTAKYEMKCDICECYHSRIIIKMRHNKAYLCCPTTKKEDVIINAITGNGYAVDLAIEKATDSDFEYEERGELYKIKNRNIYSKSTGMKRYERERTLYVSAQMGVGKSKAITKYLKKHYFDDDYRILIVTFRRTFAYKCHEQLKKAGLDFTLYSDVDDTMITDQRVIIQTESLHRIPLFDDDPPDLVILDECESIFEQINSGLFGTRFGRCWDRFHRLLRISERLILLDANIGDRTYHIVTKARGDQGEFFHCNTYTRAMDDEYRITTNPNVLVQYMIKDLEDGRKIAVAGNTKKCIKSMLGILKKKFGDKKHFGYYDSETREDIKASHFSDVDTYWKYDCLMYTPTVSAGVSFEAKHYDRVYGVFTPHSSSVESCQQMLGRIRDVALKSYYIYIDPIYMSYVTDRGKIVNALKQEYSELQKEIADDQLSISFASECKYNGTMGNFGKFESIGYNSSGVYNSLYFVLWVENTRSKNLSRNNFMLRFIQYLKLYEAGIEALPEISYDEKKIDVLGGMLGISKRQRRDIAEAENITDEDAHEIQKKMDAQETVDKKSLDSFRKYNLAWFYDVDMDKIDPDFVKTCQKTKTKQIYRNLEILSKYIKMVDKSLCGIPGVLNPLKLEPSEQCINEMFKEMSNHDKDVVDDMKCLGYNSDSIDRCLLGTRFKHSRHLLLHRLLQLCGFNKGLFENTMIYADMVYGNIHKNKKQIKAIINQAQTLMGISISRKKMGVTTSEYYFKSIRKIINTFYGGSIHVSKGDGSKRYEIHKPELIEYLDKFKKLNWVTEK